MRTKKFIKWSLITVGISIVLFLALGAHLYVVTDHFYAAKGPQQQLARIDFQQDLSDVQIAAVRQTVSSMPAVQKTYYNANDDILVYSYTIGEQNQDKVYSTLMRSGNYQATRFIAEEKSSSGCPVMSGHSSGLLRVYKNIFSILN